MESLFILSTQQIESKGIMFGTFLGTIKGNVGVYFVATATKVQHVYQLKKREISRIGLA